MGLNNVSIYQTIADVVEKGEQAALCIIIETSGSTPRHTGSKMLVFPDGRIVGTVGGGEVENRVIQEALTSLKENNSKMLHYNMVNPKEGDPGVCGGQLDVFIEPLTSRAKLVIIGAGHVGKALTHLAKWLGFITYVSDDRAEFCTPEFTPEADGYYPVSMNELPQKMDISSNTYLILTTRGSNIDIEGLAPLLETKARYIGVIGSKRRWLVTRKGLLEKGVSENKLDQVHSPLGLELKAETPEEIAVSIMAEILMDQHGGTGLRMNG